MRIREGFIMKKLGSGYVVVTVGRASRVFNGLIRINPAGARIWKAIEDGADTREKLVRFLLDTYEDLDRTTAEKDVAEFLEKISPALEE